VKINKSYIVYYMLIFISTFIFNFCGWSDADQLFVSASEDDYDTVKMLLDKGVDVNHKFLHRQRDLEPYETPLIAAAEHGHFKIVKLLVESGAQLEDYNTANERTPLFMAVKYKHRKIIEYLLSKGADPMTDESFSINVLMLAIQQNDFNLIKLLIRYGAWPDPRAKATDFKNDIYGLNAIGVAKKLKRPYVNYLIRQRNYCHKVFLTKISCKRF